MLTLVSIRIPLDRETPKYIKAAKEELISLYDMFGDPDRQKVTNGGLKIVWYPIELDQDEITKVQWLVSKAIPNAVLNINRYTRPDRRKTKKEIDRALEFKMARDGVNQKEFKVFLSRIEANHDKVKRSLKAEVDKRRREGL